MQDLHHEHRQRMKKRFIKEGYHNFAQHELLELLLYYAIPQKDTNGLAHQLIRHFGSFSNVFDASFEELKKVKGIGDHSAILIKLIPALSSVYLEDMNQDGLPLDTTEKTGKYMIPKFVGVTNEQFYLLCLDTNCRLLACELLFEGTINAVPVNIRKIVEMVVRYNAASIILAHNHPQGFALPSSDDLNTTLSVKKALSAMNIQLVDHIIVAKNDFVSLKDSGLLG